MNTFCFLSDGFTTLVLCWWLLEFVPKLQAAAAPAAAAAALPGICPAAPDPPLFLLNMSRKPRRKRFDITL